jgi:hypothetical protein
MCAATLELFSTSGSHPLSKIHYNDVLTCSFSLPPLSLVHSAPALSRSQRDVRLSGRLYTL